MAAPGRAAALAVETNELTRPLYEEEAVELARWFATYRPNELAQMLGVSERIAAETQARFDAYCDPGRATMPALSAYTGVVFRQIDAPTLTTSDLSYAQGHLLITSFLYGLLRPLDLISPYRMEGRVRLTREAGEPTLFAWWRPRLTEQFISRIQAAGGTLINLASAEMQQLFDWRRVRSEVRVVTPEFVVRRGDRLRTVTVYAKQCRGAMTRHILTHRPETPEALCETGVMGFGYDEALSDADRLVFVKEERP